MNRVIVLFVAVAMATLAWPCGCLSAERPHAGATAALFAAVLCCEPSTGADGAPVAPPAAAETAGAPELPRYLRWRRMEANYLRANVRHPALYYDSPQEKLKHDDAAADSVPGAAAAVLYEIVQFPIQLAATPILWVLKPPWTFESTVP